MSIQDTFENEENKPTPVLTLVPGGKGPDEPNWLGFLPEGTTFLCRPKVHIRQVMDKAAAMFLNEYEIVTTLDTRWTKLYTNLNADAFAWVDAFDFSNKYELVRIIGQTKND